MTRTDPVQMVLGRLRGVKAAGRSQWQAKCPVHDDAHASLSIGQGDKGVVLHCHAGCKTEDIVAALGLTARELFTAGPGRPRPLRPKTVFATAEDAFAAAARQEGAEFVAQWQYPGDTFRVGRFDRPGGGKTFRPIHRAGNGWAMGDPSGKLPLYRPAEIPSAGPVVVCEGEKCADAAWDVSLPAVTSSHGAGSAHKTDWTSLAGREVIILPDCDGAGEKYAAEVAAILAGLNPPATVKIVRLPGLEAGGDIADWISPDGSMGSKSADEIRSCILALAAEAQAWTAPEAPTQSSIVRPAFVTVSDLLAKFPSQREPVIEGLLRRGEVGNLVSAPKMNKSWFLLHTALCVAFGRNVLTFSTRPGRVLLLDYELAPGTLAKRLQAVITAMGLTPAAVGDRLAIESLRGRRLDVDGLAEYFSAIKPGDFDLVILDPLYRTFPKRSVLARSFDENSNSDLAELYGTLCSYAERLNAGLLVVHHLTKGDQSAKATTDLGAGGGTQSRAADAHLAIRPHAQDGAAVLSGVVRSFPPFDPFCMKWDFPLWVLADDLDPADLKRPPRRNAAPKDPPVPEQPAKPTYDVNRFVAEFLVQGPRTKATILAAAMDEGLSERRAVKFLESAAAQNKVHRWDMGKDRRAFYATEPQPKLTDGQET